MTDDIKGEVAEILELAQKPDASEGSISFTQFWTDQIHSLYLSKFKEMVEGIENPFSFATGEVIPKYEKQYDAYKLSQQELLNKLEEMNKD